MGGAKPDKEGVPDPDVWVDRYGDQLYRYALIRLRDPSLAEEVVQDTFLSALKAIDQFQGRGDFGAWLMGICKRRVIDVLRARSRTTHIEADEDSTDPAERLFDRTGKWRVDPGQWLTTPDREVERAEFWRMLDKCLQKLPPRHAALFTLRELDGLSTEELCNEFGITRSNLWVILHRARLALADCLRNYLYG